MPPPPPDLPTLEQLLATLAERPLNESEQQRLNNLVREDESQLDRLLANLEMDAMLQWHFGRVPQSEVPARHDGQDGPSAKASVSGSVIRRRRLTSTSVAAAVVIAAVGLGLFLLLPHPPSGSPAPGEPVRLTSGWLVHPTGATRFEVTDMQHLKLNHGELFVQTAPGNKIPAAPLWIETPSATAQADGTEFYIGAHPPQNSEGTTMNPLTRVLVLAGIVTLSNLEGDVRGQAGELLTAEADAAPVRMVVSANNDFAWSVYGRLAAESPGENLFFSPYSISTALAMAAEGARGQTALEMGHVLGFPEEARRIGDDAQLIPWRMALLNTGMAQLQTRLDASDDDETREIRERIAALRAELGDVNRRTTELDEQNDFNATFASQRRGRALAREINELLTQVEQYELSVANAVWGDRSFPFDDAYVATVDETFRTGGVFTVDFAGDHENARGEINSWIEEQTGGLIPDMLGPRSVSPLTRLVLTNAVYFLGHWSEPFDEGSTLPIPFQLADGDSVEFPVMYGLKHGARYGAVNADGSWFATPDEVRRDGADEDSRYPDDQGFQILEMTYKGEELSMMFILPRTTDGLAQLNELLTAGRLDEWIDETSRRDVRVTIPKFDSEGSYSLAETLRQLGMERAFAAEPQPLGADFSGMTVSQDTQNQLYLQDVIHRARISVHERGTEAVAATVVVAEPNAAAPPVEIVPFTPDFKADRPFVYLIRDRESGAILFLGSMQNPARND